MNPPPPSGAEAESAVAAKEADPTRRAAALAFATMSDNPCSIYGRSPKSSIFEAVEKNECRKILQYFGEIAENRRRILQSLLREIGVLNLGL